MCAQIPSSRVYRINETIHRSWNSSLDFRRYSHFQIELYLTKTSTLVMEPANSITDLQGAAPLSQDHIALPGPICTFPGVILPQYWRSSLIPVNVTFHMFVNQETFGCKFVTQSSDVSTHTFLSLTNLQADRETSSLSLSQITPYESSNLRLVPDWSMKIIPFFDASYQIVPCPSLCQQWDRLLIPVEILFRLLLDR